MATEEETMSDIVATLSFTKPPPAKEASMVINILLNYVDHGGKDYIIYEWTVRPYGQDGHLAFDAGRALIGPDPKRPAAVAKDFHVIYLLAPSLLKDLSFNWAQLAQGKVPTKDLVGVLRLPPRTTIGDLPAFGSGAPLVLDGKLLVRKGHEAYAGGWRIEGFVSNNTAVFHTH